MKKLHLPILLVLLLVLTANAQTQLKKWYINSYEYDMTNATPTSIPLSNGQTGASNGIYDLNEDLQFYINGNTIYDRLNNAITNLPSNNIQEVSIIPFFNNDPCHNKYYVFYEYIYPMNSGSLQYVIIDVDRDTWGLTISTPFYMLHGVVATGGALAVGNVVNSNERYLYYAYGTNYNANLVKFTITNPTPTHPNGVILPGNTLLTSTSNSYSAPDFELDLSPDGTKIAWGGGLNGDIYAFSLDANGNNPNLISAFTLPNSTSIFKTGIEFNNASTKLYAGSGGKSGSLDGIYVKDLGNNNPPNLIGGTQIYGAGQIETAYNGLVYITSGNDMIGINQNTDLLDINSQISLPGFNNYFLPDQLDGTNYDDLLNNEMIYDINNYLVQSGTHIWEPLNNPFGNTINPVKVKDFLHFISSTPGVFTQVTIKNMVFEFGDNAEMLIGNSARVILENTTLKSVNCAVMWKGITLNDNANLTTTNNLLGQNSIIQDALTGISGSGLDFRLTVHGNTLFKANQDDIRLTNYEGGNIDLHNCDFLGDVVLKDPFLGSNNGWIDNLYRTNTQLKLIDGVNNTIVGNNCNFSFGQIGIKIEKTNATINNCSFLMQKVHGISGDAKRIAQKQIDIKDNLFTSVQQPIRLENWINSQIQSNHLYGSKEWGIHYLENENCNLVIGHLTDPSKGNVLDFCNWAGIDLSENSGPQTKINIGHNIINNHPYATGIVVSEYGSGSSPSYFSFRINNNSMKKIGAGIKLYNIEGWNTNYFGVGPTPHDALFNSANLIDSNKINFTTELDPYKIGIQTTNSSKLNIHVNTVETDAGYDWRNTGILTDDAYWTSIYNNISTGGSGIRIGGNMLYSNVYCNSLPKSFTGIFLNYCYLRGVGDYHGIIPTQARENSFPSTMGGFDMRMYYSNNDLNQWIFYSIIPTIDYTFASGVLPTIEGGYGNDVCSGETPLPPPSENGDEGKMYPSNNTQNRNSGGVSTQKILIPSEFGLKKPLNNYSRINAYKAAIRNAKDSLSFNLTKNDFVNKIARIEQYIQNKKIDSAKIIMNSISPNNPLEKELLDIYTLLFQAKQHNHTLTGREEEQLLHIARKNQFTQSIASPLARTIAKQILHIDIYDSIEFIPEIKGIISSNCAISSRAGIMVQLVNMDNSPTGVFTTTDSTGSFIISDKKLNKLSSVLNYKLICIFPDSSKAQSSANTLGNFMQLKGVELYCQTNLLKTKKSEDRTAEIILTKIYPNPSNGLFTIENGQENSEAIVYDLLGKVVFTQKLSNKTNIDLSTQPKGVYFIKIIGAKTESFKLIIE